MAMKVFAFFALVGMVACQSCASGDESCVQDSDEADEVSMLAIHKAKMVAKQATTPKTDPETDDDSVLKPTPEKDVDGSEEIKVDGVRPPPEGPKISDATKKQMAAAFGLDVSTQKQVAVASELLVVNASSGSCHAQPPYGWFGNTGVKAGIFNQPAFCGSSQRHTLNSGHPTSVWMCAFLTRQSPSACSSGYFYTNAEGIDPAQTAGVCKCCTKSPHDEAAKYYKSSSCNYVYYASSGLHIR